MRPVVLLDLLHGCCPTCAGSALRDESASDPHVFLLCGKRYRDKKDFSDAFPNLCGSVRVLDSGSTAECVYRFKRTVDQLGLSSVTVLTTPRGRDVLAVYQQQLFTAVYTFEYKVRRADGLTCPSRACADHTDSPGAAVHEEDVSGFMQQLPALRGGVSVLRSSLIPGRSKTGSLDPLLCGNRKF